MIRRLAFATLLLAPAIGRAQTPDTVYLGTLYDTVEKADPRFRQIALHDEIMELSLSSLAASRKPQVEFSARATYQNETASIPFESGMLPGLSIPTPPKDQYEFAAEVQQLVYDGGQINRQERLLRARRAERTAEVEAALYALRSEINAAYFATLLHQEQRTQLDVLTGDLQARVRLVSAQVGDGIALPSDEAALEAELIAARQRMTAAEAARRAARRRLEMLTHRTYATGTIFAMPLLEREADAAIAAVLDSGDVVQRPELDRFARARERVHAEAEAKRTELKPQISAFARVAAGRPGFNFFDESFRPYGIVGLRARWSPFDWGATSDRAAALERRQDILDTEEAAFEARLRREVLDAVYAVERLEAVLVSDRHAVALRERVERTARRQLEEGVLLAAEYVQKRNDVFEARLQRRLHRVELAEARARLLTILGIAIPAGGDGLRESLAEPRPFTLTSEN